MNKDIISKDIFKSIVKDISKHILKLEFQEIDFVDKEFERIESRRADIVAKIDNKYILHIEMQSEYETNFEYRMLRYWVDIKQVFPMPVKQFLIFLGNRNVKNFIDEDGVKFRFEVIDLKKLIVTIF